MGLESASAAIPYSVDSFDDCHDIPVISGDLVWIEDTQTCVINGIVSIPDDNIRIEAFKNLAVNSTGTLYVNDISGRGELVNNGTMYLYGRIDLNNGNAVNNGIFFNSGAFSVVSVHNHGIFRNGGSLDLESDSTNSGMIYNHQGMFMAGFTNSGIINNYNQINTGGFPNPGKINNVGTLNLQSSTWFNAGTVVNCGGMIIEGTVDGNAPTETSCDIDPLIHAIRVNGDYGVIPNRLLPINASVNFQFESDDPNQTSVLLRIISPSGEISEYTRTLVNHKAFINYKLDEPGVWLVEAELDRSIVATSSATTSHLVIPESPIGILALIGSSLAALGAFIFLRKKGTVNYSSDGIA